MTVDGFHGAHGPKVRVPKKKKPRLTNSISGSRTAFYYVYGGLVKMPKNRTVGPNGCEPLIDNIICTQYSTIVLF